MIISRMPQGGGEKHGAIISVTFSEEFVGGTCILYCDGIEVGRKNVTQSLELNFKSIMQKGAYRVTATKDTITTYEDLDVTDTDIVEQNVKNIFLQATQIVTFADGTDEQISEMIDAHYRGIINVSDYWAEGDERIIPYGDNEISVVIVGFDNYDLLEPTEFRTKTMMTLQTKDVITDLGSIRICSGGTYHWNYLHSSIGIVGACETFYSKLNAFMQNLIKTIPLSYEKSLYESGITNQKVFLESIGDATGGLGTWLSVQANRVKAYRYYTRSLYYASNTGKFGSYYIEANGNTNATYTTNGFIAPMFCL